MIDHLEGEACDPVLDAEQGLIIIESFATITIQKNDSASSFCIGPYLGPRQVLCPTVLQALRPTLPQAAHQALSITRAHFASPSQSPSGLP